MHLRTHYGKKRFWKRLVRGVQKRGIFLECLRMWSCLAGWGKKSYNFPEGVELDLKNDLPSESIVENSVGRSSWASACHCNALLLKFYAVLIAVDVEVSQGPWYSNQRGT